MLCDSNIIIYAADPADVFCAPYLLSDDASVSSISIIEVLGFPGWARLPEDHRSRLHVIVASLIELKVDPNVIKCAIALRQQKKMSLADAVIAATALCHEVPLITRNVDDFNHIAGLTIINPFESSNLPNFGKTMKTPQPTDQPITPQRIMQMTWGFAPPLILEAATQNRVFDVLDKGPLTIEELARETKTNARGLAAICNALVGLDFLRREGEKFTLSPESAAFLVSTKPGFQGGLLHHVSRQLVSPWLNLSEIVRTGVPRQKVDIQGEGAKFFADFVEDIFAMSAGPATAFAESIADRLNKPTRVLDIAAGSGVWGIMLAGKRPKVSVTAVDWPGVLPVTRRVAAKHGVANQMSYVEGDLQEVAYGSGFNIATLGHILHSEGPVKSQKLLKKVFDALAPGGTIVIAEFIPDDDRKGPPMPLLFAVNMLVNTSDGDTFTMKEISGWLKAAGFKNIRTLDAHGPSPLVIADK